MEMLDEEHDSLPQQPADHNVYKLGSINSHNIVVAGLPTTGNCSAATVVAQMRMTFPNLQYGLLVGIGGGVPTKTDHGFIRLGHVVVGTPAGTHSGTVQYDHGKAKEGSFERTRSIPPPPTFLLNAVRSLAVQRERQDQDAVWEDAQRPLKKRRGARRFKFPGVANDHLYPQHYIHQQHGKSCTEGGCDPGQRIQRFIDEDEVSFVVVHRGTIASGELVIKTAALRDRLAEQHGVLCFEMEAVGALADFPCMVIRGISDYCDSHKNDQWHGYAAAVAAAYARQLFFHLPEEARKNDIPKSQPANFRLPFSLPGVFEVPQFVAREEELRQVHAILSTNTGRRTAIVHGLGGMGKTQLAIAYTKRHRTEYSAAIWLNARDESALQRSFTQVAEQILRYDPSTAYVGLAVEGQDADRIIEAVKRWLDEPANDNWLLICDNYDTPTTSTSPQRRGRTSLTDQDHPDAEAKGHQDQTDAKAFDLGLYLPQTDHGAVIITSRLPVKMGQPIRLGKLPDDENALEILASTSGRSGIKQEPGAALLARRLDGLPLALATAGAYLEQVAMTCAEYLELYHESWLQLHQDTPQLPSYDQTLYSTWNLSYRHIKRQDPIAALFLQQWAYFSNEDIWYELLKGDEETVPGWRAKLATTKPEWLSEMTKNKLRFHSTMRTLCNHGLAEVCPATVMRGQESQGYSVHACVHSWVKVVLNQEINPTLAQSALNCVASHVPAREQRASWIVQRRLLAHADRCLETMESLNLEAEAAVALHSLGNLYFDLGRLQDAEAMYQQALIGGEAELGPDHTSTLATVNNLGLLYAGLGRLQDAEAMYQRALDGYEKALGPDHTSTLDTVNNLGNLYLDLRRLQDAEAMYKRALDGQEKALGPDHTSTLDTVNNLGNLYLDLGRLQDAEAMYKRALDGYEKALGPTLVVTYTPFLHTLENLADLKLRLGQTGDALSYYQRVQVGVEAVWGPESQRFTRVASKIGTMASNAA